MLVIIDPILSLSRPVKTVLGEGSPFGGNRDRDKWPGDRCFLTQSSRLDDCTGIIHCRKRITYFQPLPSSGRDGWGGPWGVAPNCHQLFALFLVSQKGFRAGRAVSAGVLKAGGTWPLLTPDWPRPLSDEDCQECRLLRFSLFFFGSDPN